VRNETAGKQEALRRFEALDSQGTKLRSGHQRALAESDRERRTLQDK